MFICNNVFQLKWQREAYCLYDDMNVTGYWVSVFQLKSQREAYCLYDDLNVTGYWVSVFQLKWQREAYCLYDDLYVTGYWVSVFQLRWQREAYCLYDDLYVTGYWVSSNTYFDDILKYKIDVLIVMVLIEMYYGSQYSVVAKWQKWHTLSIPQQEELEDSKGR